MSEVASGRSDFEQFYAATAAAIRAYILSHCRDRASADDLFQTTYVKFLGSRMAANPLARGARAYLYKVASSVLADHGRSLRRAGWSVEDGPEPVAKRPDIHPADRLALREALGTLSAREQQLLWLAHAEGFAHKEVASIMNLSPRSVRVLLFRARKKLARRMGSRPTGREASRP